MPGGRAHAAMSALAALGLYWLGAQSGQPDAMSQALAAGCVAGIVITPDLDVDRPVRSHHVVRRKFGPVLAALWRLIWLPYGLAIRHRSWVSHMPVVGTFIRAAYVVCIGSLVSWLLKLGGHAPFSIGEIMPLLPWALIGLAVSDALHWAADVFWTGLRRRL